jgi:hypothetical protein
VSGSPGRSTCSSFAETQNPAFIGREKNLPRIGRRMSRADQGKRASARENASASASTSAKCL